MNKWRIYYADGTIRSYKDGPPNGDVDEKEQHLHFNVEVILQKRHDENFHLLHGHDYYILTTTNFWIPVDRDSVIRRYMFHREETICICQGFALTLPEYQKIYERAKRDKDKEALD